MRSSQDATVNRGKTIRDGIWNRVLGKTGISADLKLTTQSATARRFRIIPFLQTLGVTPFGQDPPGFSDL